MHVNNEPVQPLARAAVLITGCSSGIGRSTAIHLAQNGFTVFATVRKEADAENLRRLGLPDLVPACPLDLSRPDHISGIMELVKAELIRRGQSGLYALINNAGGGFVAPVELMDLGRFRLELEARILGSVALVQACLPLIRQAGGRILWIVTPGLLPTPYVSSIHACDFAVNCLARTLEIELKPWNIPNVMIRCGGIQTPAPARTMADLEEAMAGWPAERAGLYAPALQRLKQELARFDAKRSGPGDVAGVVLTALRASSPKRRYQVGYMAGAASLIEALPQALADVLISKRG